MNEEIQEEIQIEEIQRQDIQDRREKYWYTDIEEITSVKELLYSSAAKYAKRPAFWVKKRRGAAYEAVSYELLLHDVEMLGTALAADGMLPGRIAVMGVGCYEWIVTYLAVVCGGGTIVPVDRELSAEEVQRLLDDSECTALFYTSDQSSKAEQLTGLKDRAVMEFYGDRTDIDTDMEDYLRNLEQQSGVDEASEAGTVSDVEAASGVGTISGAESWKSLIAKGEALIKGSCVVFRDIAVNPYEMSVLLYTSGTTGVPKGVMLSQWNIVSNIMDTCRIAHIKPEDKTLSILPIHHTYECTYGMLLVLYRGASTAFCEGLKYISRNMSEARNTVFIAVPLVLELFYDKIVKQIKKLGKEKTLNRAVSFNNRLKTVGLDMNRLLFRSIHKGLGGRLRMVITGAAAISPNVFRGFEDLGITVLQGYGLTECTPLVAGTPERARERYKKAGSVGVAVRSGQVKIIDRDSNGIGKILFKGPNVMLGYYRQPEETAKVLKDGWFETGDLGFEDRDGWLYITGRYKNIIVNKTGENIYPEEVEYVLNGIPCVSEAMVYARRKDGEDTVAAQILPDMEYISEELGYVPDDEELNAYIKKRVNEANMSLTSYKRVRDVIVRKEDFVRTTTRKIKRQDNIQ